MTMPKSKSKYVRDAIKGLAFTDANRKYLHDLLTIERFVINGPRSSAGGMLEMKLRSAYRGAFDQILRELNPARHAQDAHDERETERFFRELQRQEIEAHARHRERDLEIWVKLGGSSK